MSNLKKKTLLIMGLLTLISCFSSISPNIRNTVPIDEYLVNDVPSKDFNIKLSAPHSRIVIYNDNWSSLAGISGSGSAGNPWVIKDLEIDGGAVNSCIHIENSNDYFKIENCTLYNARGGGGGSDYYAGLRIIQSNNGILVNNTIHDNGKYGITLQDNSDNFIIQSNIITNQTNRDGIVIVSNCDNISIIDNIINSSAFCGIIFSDTYDNITIRDNIIHNTGNDGIQFDLDGGIDCNNIIIDNNTIHNHGEYGVRFWQLSAALFDNITFINNKIYESQWTGLWMYVVTNSKFINNHIHDNIGNGIQVGGDCDNNNFTQNRIEGNSGYGFFLEYTSSDFNYIFNNSFLQNNVHARDTSTLNENYWNNSVIGNYWDNYTGIDADEDGIGDTAYAYITGTSGNQDELPIWEDGFSGNNLYIDELKSNNWEWACTQAWCSGSGTQEDPYVISPSNIDAGGWGCGIMINNSRAYFKIEGSKIIGSDWNLFGYPNYSAGIKFQNTTNGLIKNNNLTDNIGFGIYLFDNSDNNTIQGNFINKNREGIRILSASDNNKLIDNYVNGSTTYGINLITDSSYPTPCNSTFISTNNVTNNSIGIYVNMQNIEGSNLTIDNNNIFWNYNYGIQIGSLSSANRLYNSAITNNDIIENRIMGLYINSMNNSLISYNNISNNNLSGTNYGLLLNGNNGYNNYTHNYIANNGEYGILVFNSGGNFGNKFYNNTMINNNINAESRRANNYWDNGSMGNYYSDYAGKDVDDDGWGDFAHPILGSGNNIDNHPIWWDAPNITIVSPTNGTFLGITAPTFSVIITEGLNDTTWYSIDGGVDFMFLGTTGTLNASEWSSIGNDNITITFYANDSRGFIGFAEVNISKDDILPLITVDLPSNNELFGKIAPSFNVTIFDINFNKSWYTIDGGITNYTFSGNETINATAWTNHINGTVTCRFYVNDSGGNINSAEITIRKDSIAPIIVIEAPVQDLSSTTPPAYNIKITEANLHKIWYTLDNGLTNITIESPDGTILDNLWEKLANGKVTIIFYANDTLGNLGSATVTINKAPELDMMIVIVIVAAIVGVIALIGIVAVKRSKKEVREKEAEIKTLKEQREEITEGDILISKEQHFCLVHKGPIEGYSYICPACGAYYCMKCVDAIKKTDDECWSCGASLDPDKAKAGLKGPKKLPDVEEKVKLEQDFEFEAKESDKKAPLKAPKAMLPKDGLSPLPPRPIEEQQKLTIKAPPIDKPKEEITEISSKKEASLTKEQAIKKFDDYIEQLNTLIQKLDIKFSAGAITQEQYIEKKTQLAEKLGEAMAKRDQLNE